MGQQALEVCQRSAELEVTGLAANNNWECIADQAARLGVKRIALTGEDAAIKAKEKLPEGEVLSGPEGIVELITKSGADLVLNALVGACGLQPTIVTLGEGIDLALANKESLVAAGDLVMKLAEATGARLLPVDSEHSALFQLIEGQPAGTVESVTITASGGPFRGMPPAELRTVKSSDALKHPTWQMGGKITIDSATLMNKGLELIEAHHLFGLPYERIEVLVHPQSIVHALVHLNDGSALAHMGYPDMRVPISFALNYPERADVDVPMLDLATTAELTFEEPNIESFPCLDLARQAGARGGTAPCILNAANEVAVDAFLDGRIGFLDIAEIVSTCLESVEIVPVTGFNDILEADRQGRLRASELAGKIGVSAT